MTTPSAPAPPVTTVWLDALRRVATAPVALAGAHALTLALAVPAALLLRQSIARDLGQSLAANALADGAAYDWWQTFAARATGLDASFTPAILGVAGTLGNLSALLEGDALPLALVLLVITYLGAWTALSGALIDRYARGRPTGVAGAGAAAAAHAGGLLRIALVGAVAWWVLLAAGQAWLARWVMPVTDTVTDERVALLVWTGRSLLVVVPLGLVTLLLDYARIRLVVEGRRSAAGAIGAAFRFLARHPAAALRLAALNGGLWLLVLVVWAALTPGVPDGGSPWTALLVGQALVALRLGVKLLGLASQTALFQSRLAHAGWIAPAATRPVCVPAGTPMAAAFATPPDLRGQA